MSYDGQQNGLDMETGALYGAGAYLTGLVVTAVMEIFGIIDIITYPEPIVIDYLSIHQFAHELNIITGGELVTEYFTLSVDLTRPPQAGLFSLFLGVVRPLHHQRTLSVP